MVVIWPYLIEKPIYSQNNNLGIILCGQILAQSIMIENVEFP